jgi:hypothetical protein
MLDETYSYLYYLDWDDEARDYIQNQIDQAPVYDQFCVKPGEDTFGSYMVSMTKSLGY